MNDRKVTGFLRAIPRSVFRSILWLTVLGVILAISGYSLYFVARHLGVPKVFAAGMSTAYDGTALLAADKSLQYAQEGRSGAAPRLVMIIFAGLSAWMNSLHSILGNESILAIPVWAGLPIAAATVFELHTSQARARALARIGKKYPSPLPSWGAVTWVLFPLLTLDKLRDYVASRAFGLSRAQLTFLKDERKDQKRRGIHAPEPSETARNVIERSGTRPAAKERAAIHSQTTERTEHVNRIPAMSGRMNGNGNGSHTINRIPPGRAAHAPHKAIREWAWDEGHLDRSKVRGILPVWIVELYEREQSQTPDTNDTGQTNDPELPETDES